MNHLDFCKAYITIAMTRGFENVHKGDTKTDAERGRSNNRPWTYSPEATLNRNTTGELACEPQT